MEDLIGFEKCLFKEDADYLQQLLHQNNIAVKVEEPKSDFDAIVGHSRDNEYYILSISFHNFDAAIKAIENDLKEKGIPPDYHLREMETSELMEILEHPDQWSRFDCAAASILLKEKGVEITDKKIKVMAAAREDFLRSQRTISNPNFLLLILLSLFGAIIAIVYGTMLYNLSQTGTDGKKEYIFSEEGRNRGLVIAIIGVLSTIAWFYYFRYR